MSRASNLLRWQPQDSAGACAAELAHSIIEPEALSAALDRVATCISDAAFVIVRVGVWQSAAFRQVWEQLENRPGAAPRLCFALDMSALGALDASVLCDDRAGFMVDGVDIDTPLSALVCERLEAVRFKPSFVTAAAHNLRQGCALEAMLGLARDMGLCSFGAHAVPGGASLVGRGEFDYLPFNDVIDLPTWRAEPRVRAKGATLQVTR